ncbi:6860_t:CDS:2 [Funneliformis caledonium]|uniref:6860_t:CDS:1 n=1 Tax=Funneliformis caledonium TaxID=1117310 RepID=A0A9N9NNL6_9GLOM|nr:6860_t:CDS:2 [Funneliformis caledonium]
MEWISLNIREDAKVSVLDSVVGENIAQPLLGELWKTKRLSATVLRVTPERISDSEMDSETDISSNTDDSSEDGEIINVSNVNNVRWTNKVITIDSHQVSRSYFSTPVVHITDISKATPRKFFE